MEIDTMAGMFRIISASLFISFALPVLLPGAVTYAAGVVTPCSEAAFKAALSGGGNVTFGCSGTITLTSEAVITADTVIDGSGQNVILDGNATTRHLRLVSTAANPRSLTLRQLTLNNGRAAPTMALPDAARGGAIMIEHQGMLTLDNVTFNSNTADDGGSAIYSWFESTLTLSHCRFNNNIATAGNDERGATIAFIGPNAVTVTASEFNNNQGIVGAAINTINAVLTIDNSRFSGNNTSAATVDSGQPNATLRGFGGAVYTDRGTVIIRNSVFDNNQARAAGGAVSLHLADQQSITIEDNSFSNNQALTLSGPGGGSGSAGAVYLFGLETGNLGASVQRNLFAGNRAVNDSGALRIQNITTDVINNTFFDNRTTAALTAQYSGGIGGAIAVFGNNPVSIRHATFAQNYASWVGGALAGNTQTSVINSIFYQNSAANGTNNWGIQQHTSCNLAGTGNIQFPANGNDCSAVTPGAVTADPLLNPLTDNGGVSQTMALANASPATGAVDSNCAALDQRGFERGLPCDLGAFESGAVDDNRIFRNGFEVQP
jgi:predicted outer membrane repeat protein